jgi:hypothetical protein
MIPPFSNRGDSEWTGCWPKREPELAPLAWWEVALGALAYAASAFLMIFIFFVILGA